MTADRYEFDVDWSDAELQQYWNDERRRTARRQYWPYAVLLGCGFFSAIAALSMNVVRPADARIVAFGGTLAAYAGWYTAVWAVRLQSKRAAAGNTSRRYRVVVDTAGMRFVDAYTDNLVRWPGCAGIETSPLLIRVTLKERRDVCLPRRYLPSDTQRDEFVAFVRQQIAAAEAGR